MNLKTPNLKYKSKRKKNENFINTNPKEKTMSCLNPKFSSETLSLNLIFFPLQIGDMPNPKIKKTMNPLTNVINAHTKPKPPKTTKEKTKLGQLKHFSSSLVMNLVPNLCVLSLVQQTLWTTRNQGWIEKWQSKGG